MRAKFIDKGLMKHTCAMIIKSDCINSANSKWSPNQKKQRVMFATSLEDMDINT